MKGLILMNNALYSQRIATKDIALIGIFAAFLAVMSQISLPMPSGVPVTIQVFAVAIVGVILGAKRGVMAVIIYILIGAIGAPVFANFRGGLEVVAGASGGYIIAWPVMTGLSGLMVKAKSSRAAVGVTILLALIGLAVVEGFGGFWWAFMTKGDLRTIMIYSVTAFIPKDIIITVLAVLLGNQIKRAAGSLLQ